MNKIYNKRSLKTVRRVLRNNMTKPEIMLWKELKNRQIQGLKFRRQHSVDDYIVDFYCPTLKLAIELDGDQHYYKKGRAKDEERDNFLKGCGIKVLRISNNEIYNNLNGIVQGLWNMLQELDK